jgi:hypothetical protein
LRGVIQAVGELEALEHARVCCFHEANRSEADAGVVLPHSPETEVTGKHEGINGEITSTHWFSKISSSASCVAAMACSATRLTSEFFGCLIGSVLFLFCA